MDNKKAIKVLKDHSSYAAFTIAKAEKFLTDRKPNGKLIAEAETLRQGFRDSIDFGTKNPAFQMSMQANHRIADNLVVLLGGKSIYKDINK